MSMTDPIADYLTRMRNAIKAGKKSVDMPYSKFKNSITEILQKANYINEFSEIESDGKKYITIKLKYFGDNCVIKGLRRVSRPGIRRYVPKEKLPRVRNGLGLAVISTSKGLLSDKQARALGIGGEVVCYIW
ncbi:MAG TPA: 30S ribosomal protein S8 [Ignavibacteria bacterium]|nr:30S ribosomal protein S8 [Ignavibacteria bacterium]